VVPGAHGHGEAPLTPEEEFERRASRAEALAAEPGPATELLRFAAGLLRLQAGVTRTLSATHRKTPLAGSPTADAAALAGPWDHFLRGLRDSPAPELAAEAKRRLGEEETVRWSHLLEFWEGQRGAEDFVARAFLRPYLELLRHLGVEVARARPAGYCPRCGGPPGISVRRPAPESDAGQRFLICAWCGEEWPAARVRCPLCQEDAPAKLPVYSSDQHPGVRIEACDACKHYVKSLDLSLDARPLPEVDDLVSVALDLWAQEQGYQRIEPGLAGI